MSAAVNPREISIIHRLDAEITEEEDAELRQLLHSSFPHAEMLRTQRHVFYVPAHRWLVRSGRGELMAQTAVHDMVITVGGRKVRIGGMAEVCVGAPFRGRGLVKRMLDAVHAWLAEEGIPFGMLFGNPEVYESSGYTLIKNPVLVTNWPPEKMAGVTMIRPITGEVWPDGPVELHGPSF